MKVKVYKLEVMVIDFNDIGEESVVNQIMRARHISPSVMSSESVEIEWDDSHPLNRTETFREEYQRMFPWRFS